MTAFEMAVSLFPQHTHTHTFQQCMLQHSSLKRSKSIHSTALWKQVRQEFDYICATPFVNRLTCLVTQYICVPAHTVWQFTKQTWLGKQSFALMEAVYGLWLLQRNPGAVVGSGLRASSTTAGSALKECIALCFVQKHSPVLRHMLLSSSPVHWSPWQWLPQTQVLRQNARRHIGNYSVVIIAHIAVCKELQGGGSCSDCLIPKHVEDVKDVAGRGFGRLVIILACGCVITAQGGFKCLA